MYNILLIGGPGSGKGTLGKYLAETTGVHLSTGELFRYHMDNNTEIGVKVKRVIEEGGLADDQITVDMMENEIMELYPSSNMFKDLRVEEKPTNKSTKSLIFDGFPRTLEQGPMLDDLLSTFGRKLDVVFFLDVPEHIMFKRMQERAILEDRKGDDDPEYCRKRIEVYQKRTKPLLDFYNDRGILVTIDGTKTIEEVRTAALTTLISDIYDNFTNSSYGPEQGNR